MFRLLLNLALLSGAAFAQPVEVVAVKSQTLDRIISLPGEILPFQRVTLHARANGYVERVNVDRGSVVRQGELLVTITAPEIAEQIAEAESKVATAEAAKAEAEARLAGVQATFERLKAASATPGAIAGLEMVQAEKSVDAARASVRAADSLIKAAQTTVKAVRFNEQFLQVTAPFAGVITERLVHPGALVGPGNGSAGGMLELQQVSRLRLVVPVPETEVSGVRIGTKVEFKVPAYATRTFTATIARIDRSLDPKTRTMPVELDVSNPRNELSPGMFPEVAWPARRAGASLLVPSTAVVTTTERTFVIRVNADTAEWVNVRKGSLSGDLVEVTGPLTPGDRVVKRANDEIRQGAKLQLK